MSSKENDILFSVLILLIGVSVALSWWRFLYQENYDLYATVDCDPALEQCFVYEDPECEGDDCVWNYKIILAPTNIVSDCKPDEGECLAAACETSGTCEVVLCSEDSRVEFEIEDACSF